MQGHRWAYWDSLSTLSSPPPDPSPPMPRNRATIHCSRKDHRSISPLPQALKPKSRSDIPDRVSEPCLPYPERPMRSGGLPPWSRPAAGSETPDRARPHTICRTNPQKPSSAAEVPHNSDMHDFPPHVHFRTMHRQPPSEAYRQANRFQDLSPAPRHAPHVRHSLPLFP